jgi:hypothetical protein
MLPPQPEDSKSGGRRLTLELDGRKLPKDQACNNIRKGKIS